MSRAVHIDGKEYLYKVGRFKIVIRMPNGKSIKLDPFEVSQYTDHYSWERDLCKRHACAGITPGLIKKYLIKNVLA